MLWLRHLISVALGRETLKLVFISINQSQSQCGSAGSPSSVSVAALRLLSPLAKRVLKMVVEEEENTTYNKQPGSRLIRTGVRSDRDPVGTV